MPGFTTRAVNPPGDGSGDSPTSSSATASVPSSVPIYQASTFAFDDPEELGRAIAGPKDESYVYSRWNNPTRAAFERAVANLEDAEAAVSFSSGMAAVASTLIALTSSGRHVVASPDLYGGTFSLATKLLPRLGVVVTRARSHRVEDLVEEFVDNTEICYVETISNPTMSVTDVPRLAKECEARGIKLIVDATFTSPYLSRPIAQGATVSLHSATKYIGGHHDLVAGVASGSKVVMATVRDVSLDLGGSGSPLDCWLAIRGLATLGLRMERHQSNALALAQFLSAHARVAEVWYPGLANHPDHEVATHTLDGFGGMLAFELPSDGAGDIAAGRSFLQKLRVAHIAASLGGIRTLVVHPASVTHTQLTAEQRAASGISDGLIRVSVGIEDRVDLLEDFTQALS